MVVTGIPKIWTTQGIFAIANSLKQIPFDDSKIKHFYGITSFNSNPPTFLTRFTGLPHINQNLPAN